MTAPRLGRTWFPHISTPPPLCTVVGTRPTVIYFGAWPDFAAAPFCLRLSPILLPNPHHAQRQILQATIQKWRRSNFAVLATSWCWSRMQTSINGRGPTAPQVCGPTAWPCIAITSEDKLLVTSTSAPSCSVAPPLSFAALPLS